MSQTTANFPDLNTQQLLARFEETGAHEPFEELMRRYGAMVYSVCFKVTRNKHDAEDATQATFLTLAVRARQAKKIEYLGPWLQKVGRRVALDIARSKRRRKAREDKHSVLQQLRHADAPHADTNVASQNVMLDELKIVLRQELDKLAPKYRMPLILHYFGGMRPDDVARELRLKPSTLGVRLHRGRKLLADAMRTRGFQLSTVVIATLLPTIVQEQVFAGLIASSSHAAAQIAAGSVLPSGISPDLFNLAVTAAHGFSFGKLKGLAIITLLLGGTWTGGTTLGARFVPSLEQLSVPSLIDWISPLLRSITAPRLPFDLRVDAVPSGADDPIFKIATLHQPREAFAWMDIDGAPALRSAESIHMHSVQALAGGELHRIPETAGSIDIAPKSQVDPALAAAIIAPAPVVPVGAESAVGTAPDRSAQAVAQHALITAAAQQSAGHRSFDQLRIDSARPGARYHLEGGSLHARSLVIGERGFGEFRQSGGSVRVAGRATLGKHAGSLGRYHLDAGTLDADALVVGDAGIGEFTQSAGITRIQQKLVVGADASGVGRVEMRGGTLSTGEIEIAASGTGSFHQTGGEIEVKPASNSVPSRPTATDHNAPTAGRVTIARTAGSNGLYQLADGALTARELFVGDAGRGAFQQSGGRSQFNSVTVGSARSGTGYVQLDGGALNLRPENADTSSSAVIVGQEGAGILQINGSISPSAIDERLPDAGVPLVVRAAPGGHGVVHGWGKVSLTGPLVLNGKIIADGLGQPRSLDFTSAQAVVNTIDNAPDQSNGWYARGNAILRLPPLLVTGDGDYTFGENDTDPILDLVNSARLTLKDVTASGAMLMSLVAPDRVDLPANASTDNDTLSAWHLDRGEVRFGAANLTIRFDHVSLALRGSTADDLTLWVFNDEQWISIDPDVLLVDADLSLLTAPIDGMFSYIALTAPGTLPTLDLPSRFRNIDATGSLPSGAIEIGIVPEPASGALLLGMAGALLTRRRRR